MLRSANEISGYSLAAKDGEIGRCRDFFFDDEFWTVRFMVADTGKWLPGRLVLISPVSIGQPDWSSQMLPVRLTKDEIEKSPGLEKHKPVSRQYEVEFFTHYGWPYYWGGAQPWGSVPNPAPLYEQKVKQEKEKSKVDDQDKHLRSAEHIKGYHIRTKDGELGHVEDFIVDDQSWEIRYMVVDTRNIWPGGKKVIVSPKWIENIDWKSSDVVVNLRTEEIKKAPEFDPSMPVNQAYETQLYDFYGRPHDW